MRPTFYEDPPVVTPALPATPNDPDDSDLATEVLTGSPTQGEEQRRLMPEPEDRMTRYLAAGKLMGKVALVTGADSGIGRAVAVGLAKEGADVAVAYLDAHEDAAVTLDLVRAFGRHAEAFPGDLGDPAHAQAVVEQVMDHFGRLDILVNNAGDPRPQADFLNVSNDQLASTFRTNVFAMMYLTRSALPYLPHGARIINTASVTAYKGHPLLIDYAATKGAIVSFTRSLAVHLAPRGILVNAVAPGPIWTPLLPMIFSPEQLAHFGEDVPLKRAGHPDEVAAAFVFLASDDASYFTGQTLHPNGGIPVGG